MPKRVATPPPPEDEPRYLAVNNPYPPQANLALKSDIEDLVRWLASCMGKRHLYALFYKKVTPNTIIIEVGRDFTGWRALLGAHAWSEVFHPTAIAPEDRNRVSRIFYSTYPSGRQVEKAGWKRIFVEEEWFDGWKPQNPVTKFPYPLTSHCETPAEDQTGYTLCRPLPLELFGMVRIVNEPAAAPPVVGSNTWVSTKGSTPNAWQKKGPTIVQVPDKLANQFTSLSLTELKSTSPPLTSATTASSSVFSPYESDDEDDEKPYIAREHAKGEFHFEPVEDDDEIDEGYGIGLNAANVWDKAESLSGWETMSKASAPPSEAPGPSGQSDFGDTFNEPEPQLCPVHGPLCSRGICTEYRKNKATWKDRAAEHGNRGRGRGTPRGRGSRGGTPMGSPGGGRGGKGSATPVSPGRSGGGSAWQGNTASLFAS
ncbi:hypothetical protein BOTBODRAFT_34873 [Botryobasidium botryosum FD-172 SS1]|uniref:Uncharacterized protein n=1 Tax=Botryobasidium botryosum (strain FD-172 SS1) TaxID=930990 RepID=A0A067MKC2_BOTB1|nr:hypothetical protein BOTBODRAFT_34873 [Botryobasidium botryosum FD-172 SS1]